MIMLILVDLVMAIITLGALPAVHLHLAHPYAEDPQETMLLPATAETWSTQILATGGIKERKVARLYGPGP